MLKARWIGGTIGNGVDLCVIYDLRSSVEKHSERKSLDFYVMPAIIKKCLENLNPDGNFIKQE